MDKLANANLRPGVRLAVFVVAASLLTMMGRANADNDSQLAQELTNPVASLIQVPFQNNFDFGGGRNNDAFRYTLNVQPVIPFTLNNDWNLITRAVIPFASWDGVFPHPESGFGDIVQSFFLSPSRPTSSGVIWGVGPVFLYPSATNSFFAGRQWGAGPTGVILQLNGLWTYGILANHIWSLTNVPSPTSPRATLSTSETEELIAEGPTTQGRWRISATFLQPFLSYTFPTHTTVFVSSESQYNWTTRQWTVPINVGANQLLKVAGQIIQIGGLVRVYAERPTGGPDWGLQFRVTWVLPTGR